MLTAGNCQEPLVVLRHSFVVYTGALRTCDNRGTRYYQNSPLLQSGILFYDVFMRPAWVAQLLPDFRPQLLRQRFLLAFQRHPALPSLRQSVQHWLLLL